MSRKTKPQSFSIESSIWEEFEPFAVKLGVSRNVLLGKLVTDYVRGTNETKFSEKEALLKARIRKLDAEIKEKNELLAIRKRKLEAETKIKEYHAKHVDVIGTNPSRQARQVMDTVVNHNKIVQPDGSFKCPRCQRRFAELEVYLQVDKMHAHMKNDHYSEYTEKERAEILAVIEN